MNYYKILSRDEKHYEMQYKTGLNINCEEFNPTGDCADGGMYFSREDIMAFLDYGPWIRQVTLCPDSKIYLNPGQPVKWKTDKFILGERREITVDVIRQLIEEGADVHADHECALKWASIEGNLEIFKFLVENGADINVNDNFVLKWASYNDHLKIVKYTVEHALKYKINIDMGIPLIWSCEGNNFEIAKYLIENGANVNKITVESSALKWACINNNIKLVKYLVENGANLMELIYSNISLSPEIAKYLNEKWKSI